MPSFRKSAKAKALGLFHRNERSPEQDRLVRITESLPFDDATISGQLKKNPFTLYQPLPPFQRGTKKHNVQTLDTRSTGLGQSLGTDTTITSNPWEAWTLDQDFLFQVYTWNAKHPENTLDHIFKKITFSIEQDQLLSGLVPDGPVPVRGFINALVHMVNLGFTIAEANVAARQFAQMALQWVEKLAAVLEEGGRDHLVSQTQTWRHLADLGKLIENICTSSYKMSTQNVSPLERASMKDKVLGFQHEFMQAIERFEIVSNIYIEIGQDDISRRLHSFNTHVTTAQQQFELVEECLARMRRATMSHVTFEDQNKVPCDPGTRIQVLDEIMKWIEDISDGSPCFFWLSGDPGVGKSAVAASIAEECETREILWAQFFINRNDDSTVNPRRYFPSIVKQMSERLPAVGYALQNVLEEQSLDLLKDDISVQATELFLKAVLVVSETTPMKPVVIVIDSLDETDPKLLKTMVETFSVLFINLPPNVKVFVSSRVENVIRDNFAHHPRAKNIHLSVSASVADVTQFLEMKVHQIMKEYHIDWSVWGHQNMTDLCVQAAGLFIWAVPAIEYIRDQVNEWGRRCLDLVLGELAKDRIVEVNMLYMMVLKQAYLKTTPWETQLFRRIVGAILAQRRPMPVEDLQGLLGLRNPTTKIPVNIEHVVRRLRTVLVSGIEEISGRTIPRVHKSFTHFITSENAEEFRVVMADANGEFAIRCIHQLTRLWEGEISKQLRYAISHWSSHLTQVVGVLVESEIDSGDDTTSEVQNPLSSLEMGASTSVSVRPTLTETNKRLNRDAISTIASSSDGTRIVCAQGESILLRDIVTGNFIGGPFNGHTDKVHSASFSPDAKSVVSASNDQTVRIWDSTTGERVGSPLEGHTGSVSTAFFSPDCKKIVSASADKTIRIWDANTGQTTHLLEGHSGPVYSAFFSADGRHIVSSSFDLTVRVWDATTGEMVHILKGHTEPASSAFFSPDGKHILSSSDDGIIIVWDAKTGARIPEYFVASNVTDARLAFTNSESDGYIETPPMPKVHSQDTTTSPPFYFFRVGDDGAAGGVGNAWLYVNHKYKFTMGAYLGQLVMIRHATLTEPKVIQV